MRRAKGRRDRRIFLWFGLGLVAIHLALFVGIERYWPEVRDPEWAELMTRLDRHRADNPDRELVVILGSSRSLFGLDAAWLSRTPDRPLVFNAAIPGAGPIVQQASLSRLSDAGVIPDRVLVEVLPVFYGRRGARFEEGNLIVSRLTWAELLPAMRVTSEPGRHLRAWLKARLVPTSAHHAALQRRLLPAVLHGPSDAPAPGAGRDAHGFFALAPDTDEARRLARIRFIVEQYERPLGDTQAERSRAEALRVLLDRCRAQGSEPILYVGPEHSTFRAKLSPTLQESVGQMLAEAAWRRGISVFDARAWLPDEEFIDGHHTDLAGAKRVSQRIEAEALRSARLSSR